MRMSLHLPSAKRMSVLGVRENVSGAESIRFPKVKDIIQTIECKCFRASHIGISNINRFFWIDHHDSMQTSDEGIVRLYKPVCPTPTLQTNVFRFPQAPTTSNRASRRRSSHAFSFAAHSPASSPPLPRRTSIASSRSVSIAQAVLYTTIEGKVLEGTTMSNWIDVYLEGEVEGSSLKPALMPINEETGTEDLPKNISIHAQEMLMELDSVLANMVEQNGSDPRRFDIRLNKHLPPPRMPSRQFASPTSTNKRDPKLIKWARKSRGSQRLCADSLDRIRYKSSPISKQSDLIAPLKSLFTASKQSSSKTELSKKSFRVSVLGRLDGLLGSIDDEFGDEIHLSSDPDWMDDDYDSRQERMRSILQEDIAALTFEYTPRSPTTGAPNESILDRFKVIAVVGDSGDRLSIAGDSDDGKEAASTRSSVRVSFAVANLSSATGLKPKPRLFSVVKRKVTNVMGHSSHSSTDIPVLTSRKSSATHTSLDLIDTDSSADEHTAHSNASTSQAAPTRRIATANPKLYPPRLASLHIPRDAHTGSISPHASNGPSLSSPTWGTRYSSLQACAAGEESPGRKRRQDSLCVSVAPVTDLRGWETGSPASTRRARREAFFSPMRTVSSGNALLG
ncbi:hypothetical protein BC830DRAFT_1114716 [Chytriomyces sp. MP71]|nr:hypothetical protein BC830DRAFT_1114716 [Chytriomyces sp. MP71]